MMSWDNLVADTRFNPTPMSSYTERFHEHHMSVFQRDAQRIIYSTPFRRLQGKTQVHPFPIYDYLRTRLTHTIEVSNVSRVLADLVEKKLSNDGDINYTGCFGDIVHAACLAHDLGNPPFGHVGEYAIQSWFEAQSVSNSLVKEVLDDESYRNDFLHFDGNAQGFRIITRLAGWRDDGGLQLSNATIAAFCKYPYPSRLSLPTKKKFGYLHAEMEYANQIFSSVGLLRKGDGKYCRHPLVFIVEAADDICYLTTDMEDAYRTNHLSYSTVYNLLHGICEKGDCLGRFSQMSEHEPQDRIAYLRAGAISALTMSAAQFFITEKENILHGRFDGGLLDNPKYRPAIKEIKDLCNSKIYTERRKIETETAGIRVIQSLLDIFGGMMCQYRSVNGALDKLSTINHHAYHLLPEHSKVKIENASNYETMLMLVDYVSGMTDRYALDLFSKLNGSSPTLGRMM